MAKQEIDLCKLIELYGSEDRCRKYLEELRWPAGVRCVRCSKGKISRIYQRNQLHCESCNHNFSVTTGTIFHDTHLPLWKWFLCTYLLCESRKGISANQVKRTLGISYKSAWYLCHRIREAMAEQDGHRLEGSVEVDRMYVAGKRHRAQSGKSFDKMPVIGIREGNNLHFMRICEVNQQVVYDIITRNGDKTVDVILTDESPECNLKLTQIRSKRHSGEECIPCEKSAAKSAFSLFKRGIVGTWHRVSVKHLPAYLNEMTWRFNNRKNPYLFRDTILRMLSANNLEFAELKNREKLQKRA